MEIENQVENQRNMDAIRNELLRFPNEDSVFATMLNKHNRTGEPLRFPPLVVADVDILGLEAKMQAADWTHNFSDDFSVSRRGNAQVQLIMKDLKLLAGTPEGNRIAFYLCDRWIPKGLYTMPDFIRPIENELRPIFENEEFEKNYQQLISKPFRKYGPAYRVIGSIIKAVEAFYFIDVPPPVINGVDIVKLEGEIHYAGPQGTVDLFKVDKNTFERINSIRNQLKIISEDTHGKRFAFQLVKEYALIDRSLLFEQLQYRDIHDILSDTSLIKHEQLNNRRMETTQVNYDEKELFRIMESLKYAGLKEVPKELIVGMLIKNQDKSTIKWDTKEDAISSNVDMYFKKANNKQYLNGFAVELSQDGKQFFRRYNRIDFGNTLTYRQTVNMAQDRAIGRDWFDKDENGKVGDRYFATAMFDFNDKDDKGNPKIVKYQNFDAAGLASQYPLDFTASEKAKEYFPENLMRGNLTDCSLRTIAGSVPLKVYMNARENKLVFQRPDGQPVDVTVKDNVAIIRDINPQIEKKNELKEGKNNGQSTGTSKDSMQAAANRGTSKRRSSKQKM